MTQGYIAENDIRDIQSILDGWSNEGWAPEDVATKPNVVPSILAIYEEYVCNLSDWSDTSILMTSCL